MLMPSDITHNLLPDVSPWVKLESLHVLNAFFSDLNSLNIDWVQLFPHLLPDFVESKIDIETNNEHDNTINKSVTELHEQVVEREQDDERNTN